MYRKVRAWVGPGFGIVLMALVWLPGCGRHLHGRGQEDTPEFTVVPVSGYSTMALGPDDIIRIMEIAGFTHSQIDQMGADLHEALKQWGAAKIRMGKRHVEATYKIQDNQVWLFTESRGLFVYDVESGQFDLGPNTASGSPGSRKFQ